MTNKGEYQAADSLIQAKGIADAQYNLAVAHKFGQGVEKSSKKTMKFYQEAARQGHIDAQLYLGVMYEEGDGVKQSYSQAKKWYLRAAKQGRQAAQVKLDLMKARMAPDL